MDIYLVNSGKCDFYDPDPPLRNALYRNNRDGTFTDVTEKAGVAAGGYGQGVAVGDYDGDGFPDLYVTQYGQSILYHNNGDGTFTDVTEKAGVAAPGWASSAVWFDYDNDGRLDLFVCTSSTSIKRKTLTCAAYNKPGYCVPAFTSRWPAGYSTTTAMEPSPMSASLQESRNISAKPGVPSLPTSTTTAGWTSSSPMTQCKFLFMNRGTVNLRRSPHWQVWDTARRAGLVRAWEWIPRTSIMTAGWTSSWPTSTTRDFPLPKQPRRNI